MQRLPSPILTYKCIDIKHNAVDFQRFLIAMSDMAIELKEKKMKKNRFVDEKG